jgi:two-component system, NarL family, nitrate/nitrite response regulator NarL
MRCAKVVIADRHPVVVHGLMSLLGAENDFKVVASCNDGRKCLQAIRDLSPDIALLDIFMPGLTGLDILAAATSEHLPTRIVFLTASAEDRDLIIAAARGAYGVVLKEAAPDVLVHCLRQVAAGRRLLPLANTESPRMQEFPTGNVTSENVLTVLTDRERQIMHLVSEGLSNKEVGRQLNISDGTIKVHLHHIYQKLAISNRTALAALAFSHHEEPSSDDDGSPPLAV